MLTPRSPCAHYQRMDAEFDDAEAYANAGQSLSQRQGLAKQTAT